MLISAQVYMCVHVYTCAHVIGSQKTSSGVTSQYHVTFIWDTLIGLPMPGRLLRCWTGSPEIFLYPLSRAEITAPHLGILMYVLDERFPDSFPARLLDPVSSEDKIAVMEMLQGLFLAHLKKFITNHKQ